MFSAAKQHSITKIASTPITSEPFPHIVVEEVFPPDFYAEIQRHMPADTSYKRLADTGRVATTYSPARLCLFPDDVESADINSETKAFWQSLFSTYGSGDFGRLWLSVFKEAIDARVKDGSTLPFGKQTQMALKTEIFLMRDGVSYRLNPHTDSPRKVVSVLFYLPSDSQHPELGTSLYVPKKQGTVSTGGNILPREDFQLVATMPYKPNTLFAFPKTTECFHGVEPVLNPSFKRDILLFDMKFK